ncbi:LysR substrate-binding domain-containing protein [Microbacterium sp. cx-59]|uniref:LysR substrate-binding domain-containing protein n=1 Tax=Microbacterium sp. cx-59 TaxID=2891207 RepID=UPI001E2FFA19|nr:LysR substrate-binding domain-containing protein [Microbacterium sp. cx-59]MCC4908277.1 transcriptional regulator [Microbacterium sp. cx-59]
MSGQRGKGREPSRRAPARTPKPGAARAPKRPTRSAPAARPASAPEPAALQGPFRLGAIPGATPGKWIDTWQERMPRNPLELVPLAVAGQTEALRRGDVDAAIVRLPIPTEGLHVIALYEERPVVMCARDSHLTAVDELSAADLEGEVLITPVDDVLSFAAPATVAPRFAPPETTEEAIAVVAAGVGIVVVPMSLARLHQRKDVAVRPLVDGPVSRVALAWDAERTDPLIDTFVGIVRGRSARSSRS